MKGPVCWWRKRMPSVVSAIVEGLMAWEPWRVSDGLWERVRPLLPVVERRYRYPGRKRLDDRVCLEGILFVLCSGLPWDAVPRELGVSGVTCWRRFDEWRAAGVWERLLALLVAQLEAEGAIDQSRFLVDASIAPAKKGARRPVAAPLIAAGAQPSAI
jgi:transposase